MYAHTTLQRPLNYVYYILCDMLICFITRFLHGYVPNPFRIRNSAKYRTRHFGPALLLLLLRAAYFCRCRTKLLRSDRRTICRCNAVFCFAMYNAYTFRAVGTSKIKKRNYGVQRSFSDRFELQRFRNTYIFTYFNGLRHYGFSDANTGPKRFRKTARVNCSSSFRSEIGVELVTVFSFYVLDG